MKRTAITKPQAWLTAALAAALGLPMALIGFAQASPLPGEATQDPAPRIEPSDDGAALLKRNNPHFPALRSDPMALSGASRRNQIPSSQNF